MEHGEFRQRRLVTVAQQPDIGCNPVPGSAETKVCKQFAGWYPASRPGRPPEKKPALNRSGAGFGGNSKEKENANHRN